MVHLAKRGLIVGMSLALVGIASPTVIVAQDCATTTPEENQAIVEQYIAAIEAGDTATVDALLHDDLVHNLSRSGMEVPNEAGNADEAATLTAAGDVTFTIEDIFAAGDNVAVRYTFDVHPDNIAGSTAAEPVTATAIAMLTIECGTIKEAHMESDVLGLLMAHGYTVDAAAS
jgi:ketosteroid isomerase-like protein